MSEYYPVELCNVEFTDRRAEVMLDNFCKTVKKADVKASHHGQTVYVSYTDEKGAHINLMLMAVSITNDQIESKY